MCVQNGLSFKCSHTAYVGNDEKDQNSCNAKFCIRSYNYETLQGTFTDMYMYVAVWMAPFAACRILPTVT